MEKICSRLELEYQRFDDLVSRLDHRLWHQETPFFGWTLFDQVAHLVFFDHEALLAMEDLTEFKKRARGIMAVIVSDRSLRAYTNSLLGCWEPNVLLQFWRDIRSRLIGLLRMKSPGDRISWYGPDMGARSFATARLMETWAHSQDVFDTLGVKRVNCKGLYPIAHLGVATFGWSFKVRNLEVPLIRPRVELKGEPTNIWKWGPRDAKERVWGSGEDFCLVVTQRRNVADTGLKWEGKNVEKWLTMAQAFAGGPQDPPAPGVRVVAWEKEYDWCKSKGNIL